MVKDYYKIPSIKGTDGYILPPLRGYARREWQRLLSDNGCVHRNRIAEVIRMKIATDARREDI